MLSVDRTRPTTSAGRISKVETLGLGTAWRDFSYLRIHTDAGLTGIGEITHPYRGAETRSLAEAMAKVAPTQLEFSGRSPMLSSTRTSRVWCIETSSPRTFSFRGITRL